MRAKATSILLSKALVGCMTLMLAFAFASVVAMADPAGSSQDEPIEIEAIALSDSKYTYDGESKVPDVTVSAAGNFLVAGTDYDIAYPDDTINAGTKTIAVIGKGRYVGAQAANYTIEPARITSLTLSRTTYAYDGKAKRPPLTVKSGDVVLKLTADYTVLYPVNSATVGTKTVRVTGTGNYTGTKTAQYKIVEAPAVPESPANVDASPVDKRITMYRLYNPNSGEHFYTSSAVERDSLKKAGWKYEGTAWTAPKISNTPVYRLYSGTDHHYTTSAHERDELKKAGWKYEGIGWYSDDSEGVTLYRLYNPHVNPSASKNNAGSHHYTTSAIERDHLKSAGWRYEGTAWYGIK